MVLLHLKLVLDFAEVALLCGVPERYIVAIYAKRNDILVDKTRLFPGGEAPMTAWLSPGGAIVLQAGYGTGSFSSGHERTRARRSRGLLPSTWKQAPIREIVRLPRAPRRCWKYKFTTPSRAPN